MRTGHRSPALVLGITVALMLSLAEAQSAPPSDTQGTPPTGQASNQNSAAVTAFLADPSALPGQYPRGGGMMVGDVRDLVIADLQVLDPLLALIPNANQDQKDAIGTGLGLAAMSLVRTNPQAGTIIQQALVKLNDQIVLAAYIAVTGDQHLAAAGPGVGGGGGAGESATATTSSTGGIGGVSSLFPNFATLNHADTFTFPTLTPGTPTNPPNSSPVSPTTPR